MVMALGAGMLGGRRAGEQKNSKANRYLLPPWASPRVPLPGLARLPLLVPGVLTRRDAVRCAVRLCFRCAVRLCFRFTVYETETATDTEKGLAAE
ncbi:hypothetical protein NDU88_001319 [Pleurodeles waltl]|uniref:Secreted protein n=1 Tax=Pleurodeles waltl TaxID=8319 RepID=A0AAV7M064_PLEWA|nr:hypothetical protein NDU88_001319 [Pleurodeles waltl]